MMELRTNLSLAFLPRAAQTLIKLSDGIALRVLEQVGKISPADSRNSETVTGASGLACELTVTHLGDLHLDLAVCLQQSSNRLTVVGLESALSHELAVENASMIADQSYGLLIGDFPMPFDQPLAQLLRKVRAYTRESAFLQGPPANSAVDRSYGEANQLHRRLTSRNVRRWRSTEARNEFRQLLQKATTQPQLIERDGEEVIVIGRELLDAYSAPKSAMELAEHFERRPMEPLDPATKAPEMAGMSELPDL